MKVDSSKYDINYYENRYGINNTQIKIPSNFDHIYQKAGSILKLTENDNVIDIGCGTGQMSFYLYLKYQCNVTGVDYSKDAIEICESNTDFLRRNSEFHHIRNKIKFLLCDIEDLPSFQRIKAVYLVDVIEHLYDEEINLILEKIKKLSGKDGIYIIIHTDNNNYLRFIRPITNFISVILGKTSYKRIKYEKEIVMQGHVNLTTARKLVKKLRLKGFDIIKLEYPEISLEITRSQIGSIGKYKIILYPIYFFGKLLFFLRPSFYQLAKYKK